MASIIIGQKFFVGKPERRFDGGRGLLEVNLSEESAQQDLNRFIILSRIQERRLAGRDAFRLGHLVGDKLIFGAVSIARFAFLALGGDCARLKRARPDVFFLAVENSPRVSLVYTLAIAMRPWVLPPP
jgi:hypothetical protein